jgi:hypothetical protein
MLVVVSLEGLWRQDILKPKLDTTIVCDSVFIFSIKSLLCDSSLFLPFFLPSYLLRLFFTPHWIEQALNVEEGRTQTVRRHEAKTEMLRLPYQLSHPLSLLQLNTATFHALHRRMRRYGHSRNCQVRELRRRRRRRRKRNKEGNREGAPSPLIRMRRN